MKISTVFGRKTLSALALMIICGSSFSRLSAQDVMMQGWYWDYPKTTTGACWADTVKLKAEALGTAGFTGIWLPPLSRTSTSNNNSNGYNPKDLYDYGEFGQGATQFGTRAQLDAAISALSAAGVKPIADLVYNHRDGGKAESNPGVKAYIESYTSSKVSGGANPFPCDRMRCVLPLGGTTGNGAGDYYFKFRSASQNARFFGSKYRIYMNTNKRSTWGGLTAKSETEPNGGSTCSEANNTIDLVRDMDGTIDNTACGVDEFKLTLAATDFNAEGDMLYIWFNDTDGGDYPDLRLMGIYSGPRGAEIYSDLIYESYTDFTGMPSGQGSMNWSNFKPNTSRPTYLEGAWDAMYFYYDYDQYIEDTKTKLYDWTRWNWSNAGIRGIRMDAVKHFSPEFVGDLLDNMHQNGMDPSVVVGEWFSTNTGELAGWVNDVKSFMNADTKAAIFPRIFDFSLRESLRNACDTYGYDVRNVFNASVVDANGLSGQHLVTFLNNHDFRETSGFNSLVQNNPILAYTYMLTNNNIGLPCIYYPDYFGYPAGGPSYYPPVKAGLKSKIDPLIKIRKDYLANGTATYLNKSGSGFANDASNNSTLLVYQVSGGIGGKEVVVAINFSGSRAQFHQQVKNLAVGTTLSDVLGNTPNAEVTVKASENNIPNDIYMDIPARSYVVWVQGSSATAPAAPSALQITTSSATSVSLSWTDNSTNETGFVLERKTGDAGTWAALQTLAANATTYTDNSIAACTKYFYRVSAVNGSLSSAASNEVSHNPVCPTAFAVSGGGSICSGGAGVSINLSGSQPGVTYTLYKGAEAQTPTVAGTGSAVSFTNITQAGVYTVKGANAYGTLDMTGSATVTVNAAPASFSITGGGAYCAGGTGVAIGLSGSETGVNYQLFQGTSASGSAVAGTGSALSFGLKTAAGTYTVEAVKASTSCKATMGGSVAVAVNPLPATFSVNGGGSYCSGGSGVKVGLSGSETGVNYQLYNASAASGPAVAGTGSPLDFGFQTVAGTYTVAAANAATGCTLDMTGSASVALSPTPAAFTVSGGGTVCAGGQGVEVGLSGSQSSVTYTLLINDTPQSATVTGTGSPVSFGLQTTAGTYTVVANRGSACELTMTGSATVTVNPSPAPFTVTGGGSYCSGGAGLPVGLSGSESGVSYQLYLGSNASGAAVSGTGAALSFGVQTVTGTYTVTATHATNGCVLPMTGSALINLSPTPNAFTVTGGGAYCAGGAGVAVGLNGSQSSVTYTLLIDGVPQASTVVGTGSAVTFALQTAAGTYTVIANRGSACELTMTGSASVAINPAPATPVITVSGTDMLSSSATDGNQWYLNGNAIQGATAKTYKATESGNYTVVVTAGGCPSAVSNTLAITLVGLKNQPVAAAFDIYPNPSSGQVKISVLAQKQSDYSIEIYNSLGARIWSRNKISVNGKFSSDVNLAGSPAGVYMVVLRSVAGSVTRKLVLKD